MKRTPSRGVPRTRSSIGSVWPFLPWSPKGSPTMTWKRSSTISPRHEVSPIRARARRVIVVTSDQGAIGQLQNCAAFFQGIDLVPGQTEVEQHRFGMLPVFGRPGGLARLAVELDR